MKKLILLMVLFPFVCLAQKIVPNQSLLSNCTKVGNYTEKEDSYKEVETDLVISAEIKNDFLFIYNFDVENAKEKSFKITKFLRKEGNEMSFTINFDGNTNTVIYNSANEGNRKTLLITDADGNFISYSENQ
jgi:hypothetical protein